MILATENQQLNVIREQAIRRLSIVDLDLNGFDINSDVDFVKIGYSATKNKVLFWLNMSLGDVVRSTKASPLIKLLGETLTDDNLKDFEADFRNDFEDTFSQEQIHLSHLKLEMDPKTKTWYLSMTVLDNITNSLIPINLEVIQ